MFAVSSPMTFSMERYLIRKTPTVIIDDDLELKKGRPGRPRRKRSDEDKNTSKKIKRQPSIEELVVEKVATEILWTTSYKPNCIKDMIGSHERFYEIKRYIEDWSCGEENEALLIIGPPGVGKTCLVYAIAQELKYKVFEVNCGLAKRIVYTTEKLHETVQTHQVCRSETPKLTTLWASPQIDINDRDDLPEIKLSSNSIILFDDVDFMISNGVHGFWRALKNLIQESKKPVILTANRYSDHLESFIYPLKIFDLDPPPPEEIVKYLSNIFNKEKNSIQSNQLSNVTAFNGDVRRALNEYQFNCNPIEDPHQKPMELTVDDYISPRTLRYELLCLGDVIASHAGILTSDQTRSYFIQGRDIPFDQMVDRRRTADDFIDSIVQLTNRVYGDEPKSQNKQRESNCGKFGQKFSEVCKKYGRFMSNQTIATEFFPYISLIYTHQNGRRYNTRGSRTAKIPIGPVDPFLIKFNVVE